MSIKIKKSGFNVPINENNFFFSTSEQNILTFFDLEDEYTRFAKEYGEKFEEIGLDENADATAVKEMIAVMKEFVQKLIDPILGEGAFEKLYAEIGEAKAIYDALPDIINYITAQLEKEGKDREKEAKKVQANALIKKKKKQK